MLNAQSQTVWFHAPHPITPAIERFMALVRSAASANAADGDCWQWIGADTFRVDDLIVTTPERFIYQEATGEELHPDEALFQLCQRPRCAGPSSPREKARQKPPRRRCLLLPDANAATIPDSGNHLPAAVATAIIRLGGLSLRLTPLDFIRR